MRRLGHGRYECTICAAVIVVETDETPFDFTVAGPDSPNERVVMLSGKEVHRCVVKATADKDTTRQA